MRARTIVTLCVLLVATGCVGWWSLAHTSDDRASDNGSATSSLSTSSSATASPSADPAPLKGRRVAGCAPAEPRGSLASTFWGMHVASPIGDDFPDAPVGAVNLTTSQVYWNQVETSPGTYDFSRLDAIVSTARGHHATPMLVLGFTPSFQARRESSSSRTTMPTASSWRAWVRAVVRRYGARLDYQIWPEPNIVGNWTGTPRQMAHLTAVAARIIHARAPRAVVVAPAMALRLEGQQKWMARLLAARPTGGSSAASIDAVAVDPFPLEHGTPEDALHLVCVAERILAKAGVDVPLWVNEINYGVPSGGHATDVQHYSDMVQAAYVARTYLLQAAIGTARVYWLGWGSYASMAVELEREGAETPAATAYRSVHDWLASGQRPACRVRHGVYTCLVAQDDGRLRIYWRERGSSVVHAKDGASTLETIAGRHRRIAPGDPVRIARTPVAVLETTAP